MARPRKQLPSRTAIVPAAMRHAAVLGLDTDVLCLRFALPADAARHEELSAPPDVAEELMRAMAPAAGGDVAVRVAAQLQGRRHTLTSLVLRASRDVREALERAARWMPLVHEGLDAALAVEGAEARWTLRGPRDARATGRYVHEVAIAHALGAVRAAGSELTPSRAWFAHARPPELGPLHAWLGTRELSFGCEDSGFAVVAASLERALPGADPRTVDAVGPLVEADLEARRAGNSFPDRVVARLVESLPSTADVAEVARAMHMSPRTLQRRLEIEQTSFTGLVDRARLSEARRLLADAGTSLTDVAFRLGFADLATFSRAFKRWTGVPPGQWRLRATTRS